MALAGQFRHKLTFTDPDGTTHEKRAAVRALNADDADVLGLETGVVGYLIRIRQSPNGPRPGPQWTTEFRARKLLVQNSYDPTGKGRELLVAATESS